MTGGANRFYSAIPDASKLRQSDLIDLFVYFLTVEVGASCATPVEINRCFSDCDLQVPANASAHLSKHLNGASPKFVKVDGGYRLQRAYREKLAGRLGDIRSVSQTSEALRKLEAKFVEGNEKSFLTELINCFEIGANRASIVLCWILTIDHLYDYVMAHHLDAFNEALSKVTDRRVKVSRIQVRDDFADIPEGKLIELLRSSGVISNDVRKILEEKLGVRNSCAHPSGVSIKPSKVVEFVDDLVENVVLKYGV